MNTCHSEILYLRIIIPIHLLFPRTAQKPSRQRLPAVSGPYTKLVWQDEFDKPGLPDPAKWKYDTGFIANHEIQYYTLNRKENAHVENGIAGHCCPQ